MILKFYPALREPRYRRYFFGQAVSILGTWVQTVAMSWLVYRLTGSALLLGWIAFLSQMPQLVISPLAGTLIDRHDKRKFFLLVQGLMVSQAALLAGLTAFDAVSPAGLVALAALFGVLNSFDTPLRQSMLSQLIDDKTRLRNAVALNASLFNAARFIGPPLAGLILSVTSETVCFALNAASFLGVAYAISRIPSAAPPRAADTSLWREFKEGVGFAWSQPLVRALLIGVAAMNLTGSSYLVLTPILAKESFGGDAQTLGWLLGAVGAGALVATLIVAARTSLAALLSQIALGWITAAGSLALLALTRRFDLALFAAFGMGAAVTSVNVSTNAILQSVTPDRLRGRIIAYFTGFRFGWDALGGLAAGALAARWDVHAALSAAAALVALGCLWALLRLPTLKRAV